MENLANIKKCGYYKLKSTDQFLIYVNYYDITAASFCVCQNIWGLQIFGTYTPAFGEANSHKPNVGILLTHTKNAFCQLFDNDVKNYAHQLVEIWQTSRKPLSCIAFVL